MVPQVITVSAKRCVGIRASRANRKAQESGNTIRLCLALGEVEANANKGNCQH